MSDEAVSGTKAVKRVRMGVIAKATGLTPSIINKMVVNGRIPYWQDEDGGNRYFDYDEALAIVEKYHRSGKENAAKADEKPPKKKPGRKPAVRNVEEPVPVAGASESAPTVAAPTPSPAPEVL